MTTARIIRRTARLLRCGLGALIALLALTLGAGAALAGERWSDLDGYKLSEVTLIGSHNTFERGHYRFFPDALQHSQVVELDVWAQPGEYQFIVSHSKPAINDNNCYKTNGTDEGTRDQDLKSCIDDLWVWHQRFPDHPLVIVKIEPKSGFLGNSTPEELDKQISNITNPRIPRANLFRPADLLTRPDGSRFATLDEAARANNWPTMAELRGKFMFQIVPGTLASDAVEEYSRRLRANRVDEVVGFPTLFIKEPGDPRYAIPPLNPDAMLWSRDWVVTFDVQAGRLIEQDIPTGWLYTNHYLLSATAADSHRDLVGMSREEFARYLSSHYKVSVVNPDAGDWAPAPTRVYAMPRGGGATMPGSGPPSEDSAGLHLRNAATGGCLALPTGAPASLTLDSCLRESQARHGTPASVHSNSVVFRTVGDSRQVALGGYCLAPRAGAVVAVSCAPVGNDTLWTFDPLNPTEIRSRFAVGCLGADASRTVRLVDCADPAARWERQGFSDLAGRYQIASATLNRCWSAAWAGSLLVLDDCAAPGTPGVGVQTFRHNTATGQLVAPRNGGDACLQIVDEDPGEIFDVPPTDSNDAWMNGRPVRLAGCDQKLASQRFAYSASEGRWLGVHGQCLGAYTAPLAGESQQRVFAFASCAIEGRALRSDGGDGVRNLWAARLIPDATAITAVAGQGTYGGAITLTATLARTEGTPGPVAGQAVSFAVPGATVVWATTDAQGVATTVVSLPSLGAGYRPIGLLASFAGTGALAPSGGLGPLTIAQARPVVALSASGDTVIGQGATFTATVGGPAAAAMPTGSVTFYDGDPARGGLPIGAAQALDGTGRASVSSAALAVGSHAIYAVYGGDANYTSGGASVAHAVRKAATTTTLASSVNPSFYGQPVTLTATVAVVAPGVVAPGGGVTFAAGGSILGSAPLVGGTASLTVGNLPGGTNSITATYGGDAATDASASPALIQIVSRVDTTTTVASGSNPSVFGQPVALTATVGVVPPGTWTPGGSVTFYGGGVSLGSAPVAGGQASLTVAGLAVGSHTITATYGGDAGANGSASPALAQVVGKADTATALAATPNPAAPGQAVTLMATVGAVAPGAGSPTGSVTFTDGMTVLGISPVGAGGVAALTVSNLAVGTHPIAATYGGDANLNGSASQPVEQRVTYNVCLLYDPSKAVKGGATIPIKVQLCDGAGANLSALAITLHAVGLVQSSTNAPGALQSPGNANPDNDFRFDPTLEGTGGYIYNLKTSGLATGTYTLTFTATGDPLPHTVQFQVK